MKQLNNPTHIYQNNENYLLAHCGPIFIVEWRDKTPMEGCLQLREECENFAKAHPSGIGLLTIIHANAPLPEKDERKEIAKFLSSNHHNIRCSAVIVEGEGFRSACVRSVVTGLTQLARQSFPHQVCSFETAAQRFNSILQVDLGISFSSARLEGDIGKLRQNALRTLKARSTAA